MSLIDHIVKCKITEYIMDNCCGIVFKKQTEFLFRWVKTGLHEGIVMHYSIFLKHWSPQSRISGIYCTYLRNKLGHPRRIPDYSAYSYCRIRLTKCTLWLNRCHHITVPVFEDFVNAAHTATMIIRIKNKKWKFMRPFVFYNHLQFLHSPFPQRP